jgi:hypothetical protein
MKKILSILLLVSALDCNSQNAVDNLKKYWKYRERLKNFVVVGDCYGCSIPAKGIGADYRLNYDDSGIKLGEYIAFLATEYKLLSDHGLNSQNTIRELFYALEAFNRVDKYAEPYWRIAPEYQMEHDPEDNLDVGEDFNGFFIRDDIKDANHFLYVDYGDKRIIDHLTASKFPLMYQYVYGFNYYPVPRDINSGFTAGVVGNNVGPIEESLDQVIQLLAGLSLVKKLVINVNYNNMQFSDNETDFKTEAQNISSRMINWMRFAESVLLPPDWYITNPEHAGCATGYAGCQNNDCSVITGCGGNNARLLCHGFNEANCWIQNSACVPDQWTVINQPLWQTQYRWYSLPGDNEDKALILAAISRIWGDKTNNKIGERCTGIKDVEWIDLLYDILHEDGYILSNMYYECLLNAADCSDINHHNNNYEWGYGDRVGDGTSQEIFSDESFGLDYLLYFNLFCVANPEYVGGGIYRYYAPEEIAEYNLYLQNINTNPGGAGINDDTERNYLAANTIVMGSNVHPEPAYPDGDYVVGPNGRITCTAGEAIVFDSGFNIISGGVLTASINNNLEGFGCPTPSNTNCSSFCEGTGNEEQPGSYNVNSVKVWRVVENELFASSGRTLFKIREEGGTGQNMFALQNNGSISSLPGYNYYIGHQEFNSHVVDLKYINGNTMIFLSNGDVLKVQGTGGQGNNMFNVTHHSGGYATAFEPGPGSPYIGEARFEGNITNVEYVSPYVLVGFDNGLILKALPDGSGHNMFNIGQSNSDIWDNHNPNDPSSTQYYIGDTKLCSAITEMKYFPVQNILFVGCADEWTVKVNGTGGSGDNMFGLVIDCGMWYNQIWDLDGDPHCNGYQQLDAAVMYAEMLNGNLFLSFDDGLMTRYNGIGGNGGSWSQGYYYGHDWFSSYATGMMYSSDLNRTMISFNDGRLLKVEGIGGGGNEMFNVDENGRGFEIHDGDEGYYEYLQGCMFFEGTGISFLSDMNGEGPVFIGLSNGTLLKLSGYGNPWNSGENMYGLAYDGAMKNLCGYQFLIGEQDFQDVDALRTSNSIADGIVNPEWKSFNMFPNPNSGMFSVAVPGVAGTELIIAMIKDISGRIVKSFEIVMMENPQTVSIDARELSNGVYLIEIEGKAQKWKSKFLISR